MSKYFVISVKMEAYNCQGTCLEIQILLIPDMKHFLYDSCNDRRHLIMQFSVEFKSEIWSMTNFIFIAHKNFS